MKDVSLILLILLLSIYLGNTEHLSYCPVSSSFNTEFDSKFGYPMDIFDKKAYEKLISDRNDKTLNEYVFNCSSIERNSIVHKCSTLTKCPIRENDVMNAIERTKSWNNFHNLCSIREKLHEPTEKINLIILGGSLTLGSGTWGCCCVKSIDKKCYDYGKYSKSFFFKDSAAYCGSESHELYGDVAKECSWPVYLYKWFKGKTLDASINLINLAESGSTSMYKSERVIDQLKRKNISHLTESDIIFIDHSVNDANSYNIKLNGNNFSYDQWVNGLESLIRRLYFHSKQESFPTIIILEQFPYNSMRTPEYNNYDTSSPSYSNAYSYVARKYSLPLWSYKDLVTSDSLGDGVDYLRFQQIANDGLHPSWFIHLYFADLIASIITLTFHECLIDNINNIKSHVIPKKEQIYDKLPSPHSLLNTSYCSDSTPYLHISGDMINNNRTNEIIGKYEYNGTWFINGNHESKLRRSGFISSYFNRSYDEISVLRFSLIDNTKSWLNSETPSILKIHYMRTYLDAGVVDIVICHNYIGTLDALWADYEHYKYTFNDIFTFDYFSHHANYCLGINNPTIEIIHRYYSPDSSSRNFDFLEDSNQYDNENKISKELSAREDQKFKLVSITFCDKQIN